jgi:hypothetical protein
MTIEDRHSFAPGVGRIVHYRSYGTPGGEYPSTCRAAVITAVNPPEDDGDRPTLDLCVLNPEGMFFNRGVYKDANGETGGTWHVPERVG